MMNTILKLCLFCFWNSLFSSWLVNDGFLKLCFASEPLFLFSECWRLMMRMSLKLVVSFASEPLFLSLLECWRLMMRMSLKLFGWVVLASLQFVQWLQFHRVFCDCFAIVWLLTGLFLLVGLQVHSLIVGWKTVVVIWLFTVLQVMQVFWKCL